jgi:hypothetical protein
MESDMMKRLNFLARKNGGIEALVAFSDEELLALSIGVATINAWNRLSIGFRLQHPADRMRTAD